MRHQIFDDPLFVEGTIEVPGTGDTPLRHTILHTPARRWVALVEVEDDAGEASAKRIADLWNKARFDLVSPHQLALEVIGEIAQRADLRSCRSYSELHNHCDANTFAAIERHQPDIDGLDDEDAQAVSDAYIDVLNAMQDTVSKMLSDGLFKTPETDEHPSRIVVVTDDSGCPSVYAPDGWYLWSEAVHIDGTTRLGGANHALIDDGSHPGWKGYRQIPTKTLK